MSKNVSFLTIKEKKKNKRGILSTLFRTIAEIDWLAVAFFLFIGAIVGGIIWFLIWAISDSNKSDALEENFTNAPKLEQVTLADFQQNFIKYSKEVSKPEYTDAVGTTIEYQLEGKSTNTETKLNKVYISAYFTFQNSLTNDKEGYQLFKQVKMPSYVVFKKEEKQKVDDFALTYLQSTYSTLSKEYTSISQNKDKNKDDLIRLKQSLTDLQKDLENAKFLVPSNYKQATKMLLDVKAQITGLNSLATNN